MGEESKLPDPMAFCRDEDCPECGWPETYSEVAGDPFFLVAIGCRKCQWRIEMQP